jgi:hypothetical protein
MFKLNVKNQEKIPVDESFCDAIVMLTWSNWFTEPRSNRYHYASRFAKKWPVVFVQPDLDTPKFQFEKTEIENILVLHVWNKCDRTTTKLINNALSQKKILKPLLWIYNSNFIDFIYTRYAVLKIYHATEDYFSNDPHSPIRGVDLSKIRACLKCVNLLVSVTDTVEQNYLHHGEYTGKSLVLENGCDADFFKPSVEQKNQIIHNYTSLKKFVAFYQGGINVRLDLELVYTLVKKMNDWDFIFCGTVHEPGEFWDKLLQLANFKYLGILSPEEIKTLSYQATVGLIPFRNHPYLVKSSLPLKAFEYVACGLPVVTVPIESLNKFHEVFNFANTVDDFERELKAIAYSRYDLTYINLRERYASFHSHDSNFNKLISYISETNQSIAKARKLNILIIYDNNSTHVNTILEHVESFYLHSTSNILYAPGTRDAECSYDLNIFDVVVIHYSVRVSLKDHLSASYDEAITNFGGYKILFIQDEYDNTNIAHEWIEKLRINAVFTCVPEQYIEMVYPKKLLGNVEFYPTLTGYTSQNNIHSIAPLPAQERTLFISYRGRALPYWYGNLGQEKMNIGINIKKICTERELPIDIEWDDSKRIYGQDWYKFLASAKATLGTESGSNVFDFGDVRTSIEKLLQINPAVTYSEVFEKILIHHEDKVKMNQISPKIFEAITLKTALILFEGDYSGVIKPNVHYISLKKDYSNIEEVLAKLHDNDYLNQLTERAFKEVIESNKFSYKSFIEEFDNFVEQRVTAKSGIQLGLQHSLYTMDFSYLCNNVKPITIPMYQPNNLVLTPKKSYYSISTPNISLMQSIIAKMKINLKYILSRIKNKLITLTKRLFAITQRS